MQLKKFPYLLRYVPDRYKTQQVCDKAFFYIPHRHKMMTLSDDPFSMRYVPDQYETQQMCDKAVDDCLAALKFVPDWFVTSKIMKYFLLVCTQKKFYSTLILIRLLAWHIEYEKCKELKNYKSRINASSVAF